MVLAGRRFDVQPQPGAVLGGDVHSRAVSASPLSIGTFLEDKRNQGRQRGSRLLFTDLFFSMAGMIFPGSPRFYWRAAFSGTGFMPASGWCMSLFLF